MRTSGENKPGKVIDGAPCMYQVEGSGLVAKSTELLRERERVKCNAAPASVHETSVVKDEPIQTDGKARGAPSRYPLS